VSHFRPWVFPTAERETLSDARNRSSHAEHLAPVTHEFEELYELYSADVRAYCLRRADPALADDAVSQTFEIAWRRRSELPRKPRGWLLGVARRMLANARRAHVRQRRLVERLSGEPVLSDDGSVPRPPVLEALARLSEDDQEALLLAAWEGLPSREASKVLGCSPAAFRLRLHRARRRLADELGELERRPTATLDHDGALVRAGEVRS
jgi:RNA polymerase sigma-70 factor, ECF subfamily